MLMNECQIAAGNIGACEPTRIISVNAMNNCGWVSRVTNAGDGLQSGGCGREDANSRFASEEERESLSQKWRSTSSEEFAAVVALSIYHENERRSCVHRRE